MMSFDDVEIFVESFDNWKYKHNAELQRADSGTKVTEKFSTRGRILPQNTQNGS